MSNIKYFIGNFGADCVNWHCYVVSIGQNQWIDHLRWRKAWVSALCS